MQIQITIVDMKLLRTIYKGIIWFFQKTYEMDTLAYRGREWDWMEEKRIKEEQQKQNDFGGPNGHLGI